MSTSKAFALAVVFALVAAACTSSGTSTSSAQPTASSSVSASLSPSPTTEPPLSAGTRVFLRPPPDDGNFLVRGLYPKVESSCKHHERGTIEARYPGALSIRTASDGTLSLTVALPFEKYLQGIAEVPPTWPAAALQAQVIAARTYALSRIGWTGAQGEALQKPICATTDCQVYGGIPVPPTPGFKRWDKAVADTTGQVLLYGDRPADTVYFSTSNGHTYGNEQVFGSDPLPYLRPVVERDDGASPTSRWRVPIPFRDLATFLSASGLWPGGAKIADVRRTGDSVRVSGPGESRSMSAGDFSGAVNASAPCLMPGRYPTDELPTTIPSGWYDATSNATEAVVTGRGWGHGVGMVQWGAYGKAKKGWSADRILAYYYGGLRPTSYPEPGLIHVVVATGLESLTVQPSKQGATILDEQVGRGSWRVTGGDVVKVRQVPSGGGGGNG